MTVDGAGDEKRGKEDDQRTDALEGQFLIHTAPDKGHQITSDEHQAN
jgi:hypothetical protein